MTAPISTGEHVWVKDLTQVHPPMNGTPHDRWTVQSINGVVAVIHLPGDNWDWRTPLSNLRRTGANPR